MKSVAVIGPRSMLGRQLIARLRAQGIATAAVGRSAADDVRFDLRDERVLVQNGLQADVVFHCAASFAGDDDEGLRQNFLANAASAIQIASLVRQLEAKTLIYAGSVFSDRASGEGNFNSYGLTKAVAEQVMTWAMEQQGKQFCSLRFAQLFDTEGRCCHHQPWFGRIIAHTARGKDIRVPRSDGVRNFLHVRDAADLMIRAAAGGVTGVLDVTHPQSLAVEAIAAIAYEVFGEGGRAVIAPEKLPFRPIHFPDGAKAFERLDLWPAIDMHEGIRMIRDAGTAQVFGPMDIT
jgi:nucleoside-diphosphate-sugar epimerase